MNTPKVIGLDLSLTSTGVAGAGWVDRIIPPKGMDGLDRLRYVRGQVMDYARPADLAVVEGLALSSTTGKAMERAGLWWMVQDHLHAAQLPVAVVTPGGRAKYATGNGKAGKDAVLAAMVRRFLDIEITGHDQADALCLAAMGMDHLGYPLVPMPATHRVALTAVAWPVDGAA